MINLEEVDHEIVLQAAEDYGLGERCFSAATRLIIREWEKLSKARDKFLFEDGDLEV
jgi:hypothetical protein